MLPLADVVLILPRGSYHIFLPRRGWWHLLWAFSCWILPCQFLYSGILAANHLPPSSGSWEDCHHLATLPNEAVTVSLRITPVAAKFSLLIEAVTTNMHCLSPSAWSDGVRGPASLTTDPVVGTTWVSTSIGPVAWPVGKSFGISTLGSVERTMASLSGRVSAGPGRVCSASTSVGKVMGSTGGVSSSGGCLNDEGVVPCAPGLL